MMIKIMNNNLIIDLCLQERYLKYLPQQQRFIEVKKYMANAVLGSDNNTVYHLSGTIKNFPVELKTVTVQSINEEEYNILSTQTILQNSKEVDLRAEVEGLKKMITEQNNLILHLIQKLK